MTFITNSEFCPKKHQKVRYYPILTISIFEHGDKYLENLIIFVYMNKEEVLSFKYGSFKF